MSLQYNAGDRLTATPWVKVGVNSMVLLPGLLT